MRPRPMSNVAGGMQCSAGELREGFRIKEKASECLPCRPRLDGLQLLLPASAAADGVVVPS